MPKSFSKKVHGKALTGGSPIKGSALAGSWEGYLGHGLDWGASVAIVCLMRTQPGAAWGRTVCLAMSLPDFDPGAAMCAKAARSEVPNFLYFPEANFWDKAFDSNPAGFGSALWALAGWEGAPSGSCSFQGLDRSRLALWLEAHPAGEGPLEFDVERLVARIEEAGLCCSAPMELEDQDEAAFARDLASSLRSAKEARLLEDSAALSNGSRPPSKLRM